MYLGKIYNIILAGNMSANENVMLVLTGLQHRWRRARDLEKRFIEHARIIKCISLASSTLKGLKN